jgi:AraC-like DNA-binding protein
LPCSVLEDFIEIFWEHKNLDSVATTRTIFPDSFLKLIVEVAEGKIIAYFITGIWSKETDITIPAKTTVYGIKFKILAPEYIFQKEFSDTLLSQINLPHDFFNIDKVTFITFESVVSQFEDILIKRLEAANKHLDPKKLQLSQMLYKMKGQLTVEDISNQLSWENRDINRYFNKYLGVPLKKYLNIQKVYAAYSQIMEGRFFPDDGFYDQPHFIREVKKYTGQTPRELFKDRNDRFIQLKNINTK